MMKKFSFYLNNTSKDEIYNGLSIGYAIRCGELRWFKKDLDKRTEGVKVTVWRSRKLLVSIKKAKLSGIVIAKGESKKAFIEAIEDTACCSVNCGICESDNKAWFCKAKVVTLKK